MAAMLRAPLGVNTVRAVAPKVAQKRSVRSFAVVNGDRIGVMGHWLPGTEPPSYLDGTMPADYGASPRDPIAIALLLSRRRRPSLRRARPPVADLSRRVPRHDRVRVDVPRDHRARADDGVIAHDDAV